MKIKLLHAGLSGKTSIALWIDLTEAMTLQIVPRELVLFIRELRDPCGVM